MRGRRLAAREHHREARVGVRAEPLVAGQSVRAVGALARERRGAGDVGPRALLGHEHRALVQRIKVERGDQRQHPLHQRRVAVAAQRARERVGHRHRTAQPELGLHKQVGQRVLGRGRHRFVPAEHAAAVRHRREPELAERDALELDVGRVLDDARLVGAAPRAHRQRRRVLVRDRRELVEAPACEPAQPVEVRREVLEELARQVGREQRRRHRVGAVEVDAARIGDGVGAGRRDAPGSGHVHRGLPAFSRPSRRTRGRSGPSGRGRRGSPSRSPRACWSRARSRWPTSAGASRASASR